MVKVEDFFLMRTISTTWRVFTDTSNLLRLRQSNNPYTKEVEVYIGLMSVFVFRYIDNYISNLISDALGVKFIISGDTAKVVSYKLELDKDECDGYCPNNSSLLQNNEAEKYREQIEMKLLTHVLRAFDLIELKKNRLIK